jgi:riboflavin synthase
METSAQKLEFCTMFTGIIETMGLVEAVLPSGTNTSFWLSSPISPELRIDQSLSHNGVCLTVEEVVNDRHRVTAIQETLNKSNLGRWQQGDRVNLERCMVMNGRLDGHIVQGHVDTTAICLAVKDKDGSHEYRFHFPEKFASLIVEKGSICLNGISLTIFDIERSAFSVAIIPYTYEHTNLKYLSPGDTVNLEFDLVGKYVTRFLQLQQ